MAEWREIQGYEGHYEVSSEGDVRSCDRVSESYGGRMCNRKGRLLKIQYSDRYVLADLCVGGLRQTHQVHQLVARAFIPNPDNKPMIDHIDRDKHNNHISNLRWATASENQHNRDLDAERVREDNNTGEKYISRLADGRYRLRITRVGYWSHIFSTLPEAIAERERLLTSPTNLITYE